MGRAQRLTDPRVPIFSGIVSRVPHQDRGEGVYGVVRMSKARCQKCLVVHSHGVLAHKVL